MFLVLELPPHPACKQSVMHPVRASGRVSRHACTVTPDGSAAQLGALAGPNHGGCDCGGHACFDKVLC